MTALDILRSHYGAKYMTVLEGDRTDAAIMLALSELRRDEDEIEEELRDPERNQYVYVVGERSRPTAAYLERCTVQPSVDSRDAG
jgi:hypothetical protein